MHVLIRGAGIAGLTLAHELVRAGAQVTVCDVRTGSAGSASWLAGGMLAPWCERESAEEPVLTLGRLAADWWDTALPGHVLRNGTLVVAPARDAAELNRFATRTDGHAWLDGDAVAALEPDLAGRFRRGLFFRDEAHLDPRRAMTALIARLKAAGVRFAYGNDTPVEADRIADCTGMAAADDGLRGVRGEMLLLRTKEISLSRPVRLLHPRIPVYIVPREGHYFMVGATMIESDDDGPISARSTMELLNAAYSLHPAFAEAKIVETGAGVRPAYADNLPRVKQTREGISVNGFYRHGFLLSPAMAQEAAALILKERVEALNEAHG
ncbi:glycine oxidase ThiO [Nitratireductor sp. GZWM139]|uniref:glycine oxidase ThiO n=1 Tax=Nitratireductor sp. GZWM139 TaxID=2950541 RepID=UPI0024BD9B06|nr:glycine oxidase ThiO [Nitratireductor sp. GZWM139]MDJ1465187.1 glycine oxidase ThiO [Nitratireductor sp. GZWM139]